jgi:hypothetical protein
MNRQLFAYYTPNSYIKCNILLIVSGFNDFSNDHMLGHEDETVYQVRQWP